MSLFFNKKIEMEMCKNDTRFKRKLKGACY